MALTGKNLDHTVQAVTFDSGTRSVTVNVDIGAIDVTCAGGGAKAYIQGIHNFSVDGEYVWDSAAGNIDATLYAAMTTGEVALSVTPAGGTLSASNPEAPILPERSYLDWLSHES